MPEHRASKEKRDTLRLAAAQAAIAACEPALAIHHLRHVCITWPHSAAVWNLLCQATIAAPAMIRQAHHTIAVLALEDKENLAMRLVNGHCHASDVSSGPPSSRPTYLLFSAFPEPTEGCTLCVMRLCESCLCRALYLILHGVAFPLILINPHFSKQSPAVSFRIYCNF